MSIYSFLLYQQFLQDICNQWQHIPVRTHRLDRWAPRRYIQLLIHLLQRTRDQRDTVHRRNRSTTLFLTNQTTINQCKRPPCDLCTIEGILRYDHMNWTCSTENIYGKNNIKLKNKLYWHDYIFYIIVILFVIGVIKMLTI